MMLRYWMGTIAFMAAMAGQTAELSGSVSTSTGTPIAGARVTVLKAPAEEAGTSMTTASGDWRVAVEPGTYELRVSADGFESQTLQDIQTPRSGVAIALLSTETAVADSRRVTYRPVVDTERTYQADFITERQLANLPMDPRNYLDLAALTPGVALVNDYVGISDAPLVQAPQSGLSFGGNNGRGNVFWLDGGENYLNSGGVRPSISQEAVAEFQVARSNYSAEFGGGLGGIVNIISKAGTNDIHGDVFGFFRGSALQTRNFFDFEKPSYTRSQVGGTFGGPLRKDRTFGFLGFERLQGNQTTYVPIGRSRGSFERLRRTQQDLVDLFLPSRDPQLVQLGAISQRLLLTTNFPQTLELFDRNRGSFPFAEHNAVGSARIDHRFSDNNNAFLRVNASSGDSQNSQVENFNAFSRTLVSDFSDQTVMLNDTYVLSARLVSESRFSISRTRFNAGNRDTVGPSIDITNYGFFGKDWTLPSRFNEWHGQLQENMFYASGRHSIRFGVDVNPVRSGAAVGTNVGGRFSFGEYLPLGGFYNIVSNDPNAANTVAAKLAQMGKPKLIADLQIELTSIQVFNLGIPAFYVQGFGDPTWSGWFNRYNFFFNDVFRVHPRLTINAGIRNEVEFAPASLGNDHNSPAPRVGLAWDLTGDRKTVLRAGYGLFYLHHQSQIAVATEIQGSKSAFYQVVVPLTGLTGLTNPRTGLPPTSADLYQTLNAQGILGKRPILASDLTQFGIVAGRSLPFQSSFQDPVNFEHGVAQQSSLEIERAFGATSLSVGYNFIRGSHLPRLRNLNVAYGPPGPLNTPTFVPRDPLIGQLLTFESAANSFYHGLFVQATRRYRDRLTFDAHYTLSKSIDESTDMNFLPNDALNAKADRGLSTSDQRHRLVGSAVLETSFRKVDAGWRRSLLNGYIVAPIVTITSGRPFNVVTGQDLNSQRPAGAGRNIGQGPTYSSFDCRISRSFVLGRSESRRLELIAEGFNILNHTNFRRLNNVVGQVTVNDLPHPLVGQAGDPTDSLSFLSAFESRHLQIALKIHF
jgi:hypothetical protein